MIETDFDSTHLLMEGNDLLVYEVALGSLDQRRWLEREERAA